MTSAIPKPSKKRAAKPGAAPKAATAAKAAVAAKPATANLGKMAVFLLLCTSVAADACMGKWVAPRRCQADVTSARSR